MAVFLHKVARRLSELHLVIVCNFFNFDIFKEIEREIYRRFFVNETVTLALRYRYVSVTLSLR